MIYFMSNKFALSEVFEIGSVIVTCSPESGQKQRSGNWKYPLARSPAFRARGKVSGSGSRTIHYEARGDHPRLSPPDRHRAQGKPRVNQSLDIRAV
jgi:hypothetical protein